MHAIDYSNIFILILTLIISVLVLRDILWGYGFPWECDQKTINILYEEICSMNKMNSELLILSDNIEQQIRNLENLTHKICQQAI